MKIWKIYSIIITVVLVLLIIGLCLYSFIFKENITESEAKTIAFEYAGVIESDVTLKYINKDNEDIEYEIVFYDDIYEYEVKVNYNNGNINHYEKEVRKDYINTQNIDDADTNDVDTNSIDTNADTTTNTTTNSVSTNNSSTSIDDFIGEERAKEIILEHAELTEDDVIFKSVEIDMERNVYVYEIEFYYNNYEYDYKVNAISGEIVKYERDRI